MPVIKLPCEKGSVILVDSGVMVKGKKIYTMPYFRAYVTTNKDERPTTKEFSACPWDTVVKVDQDNTMTFAKPFVRLSERAPHVKSVMWDDYCPDAQKNLGFLRNTPRLSWAIRFAGIRNRKQEKTLAFATGGHARLGGGSIVARLDPELIKLIGSLVLVA